jgi:uncharacterized membrane protein YqjE
MAYTHHTRSIPEIFTDVVAQFGSLLRTESELARAEFSENIAKAGMGLTLVVIGAVLLIPALVVVLQALVIALAAQGLSDATAAALVGGVVLIAGLVLMLVGVKRLKPDRMIPNRTIHQLQQDVIVAKEQVRRTDDELHRAA